MQAIQLTLFDIEQPCRRSVIKYLASVSWDNHIEMILRSACTFISTAALVAITSMPCAAPETKDLVERTVVERRRKRRFGTNIIILNDHSRMYVHWRKNAAGKTISRDTVIDGTPHKDFLKEKATGETAAHS